MAAWIRSYRSCRWAWSSWDTGLRRTSSSASALVGLAELMLSGCTTAADHLYIYPNGCRID
ncbi:MAG TPA: hypothetical protein EYP77_05470, partial [Anaerolineae bacterium]|nr:hypothetical protein [Anaerolineae bacterium]